MILALTVLETDTSVEFHVTLYICANLIMESLSNLDLIIYAYHYLNCMTNLLWIFRVLIKTFRFTFYLNVQRGQSVSQFGLWI